MPVGGTSPYAYLWANNATTATITGLSAGSYGVQVTDANNCTQLEYFTVGEAIAISASFTTTDVLCSGDLSGEIDLTVSGGLSPYAYLWSNGLNTEDLQGLSAGMYQVTISDVNNCVYADSVEIIEPSLLTASTVVLTNNGGYGVSCNGDSDGSGQVLATGGTSPYTYLWSNGESTSIISGLSAGIYTVTVSDTNGCTAVSVISGTQAVNWDFAITSDNHQIMIQPSSLITVDGNTISNGDLVGVFYDSLGTDVCAGYISWQGNMEVMSAYGATSGLVNGFAGNEEMTWKIFTGGNTVDAVAVYSTDAVFSNAGNWALNGLSGIVSITGTTSATVTSDSISIEITEPLPILSNVVISDFNGVNISCNGATDGSIVSQTSGGVHPFESTIVSS